MAAERTYSDAEIKQHLSDLPGWTHQDGMLRRTFKTDGWPTTLMLVNAIGFVSEAADHHPDLAVSWGRVQVSLRTHSARGVTDKDVALARLIERTALWRPTSQDPFRGTPKQFVMPADP